jgi:hypothetical protein
MAGSTISNHVTISVTLGSGSYHSPLTLVSTGFIEPSPGDVTGPAALIATINAGYVLNQGTIAGDYYGGPGGSGGAGTSITSGSLTNEGAITGGLGSASYAFGGAGGAGVLLASASLTNEGTIAGGAGGASYGYGPPGIGAGGSGGVGVYVQSGGVTNDGTIAGGRGGDGAYHGGGSGGTGVSLRTDSILTNNGRITGGRHGIYFAISYFYYFAGFGVDAANSTVTNQGTIAGGNGVDLTSSTLTNSGTISCGLYVGGLYGNGVDAASSTLTNNGTIIGGTAGNGVDATSSILTNNGTISGGYYGIILASGGSVTNAASAVIAGRDGVSVTGAGTVVNAGTINGLGGAAVVFGGAGDRLIVDAGAVFGGGVVVQGTSATLELASAAGAGTITDIGSSFTGFGTIVADSGATWTVTGPVTGSATIRVGAGSHLILGGSVAATSTVQFTAATGTLGLGDPAGFGATVHGLQPGDAIDFTSISSAGSIIAGVNGSHHLTLRSDGILLTEIKLDPAQKFIGDSFHAAPDDGSGTVVTESTAPICFLTGTMIATPSGETPIEQLAAGDQVVTAGGAARPIVWIGTGRVLATRYRRSAATPVIVRKGALAENVPHRDLHVTKAHALYIDDVLIPVEFLINHRSVLWDDRAQEVVLYHIELETHDVLLANGAPTESYRDDGNRWLFQNANSGWGLPPQVPCAPVLTGGGHVDDVWRRLLERAGPRNSPPLTEDADLHLVMDGQRLDAAEHVGEAHVFHLSAMPSTLHIVSRAAAPAELGLARDPRVLGVALRRLALRKGTRFRTIEAKDDRLTDGFHAFETDNRFRWTDGDAAIPTDLCAGFTAPLELVLHIGCTTRYLADDGGRRLTVANLNH